MLLMDDIYLKFILEYECCHVYREVNRTINCLAKKVLVSYILVFGGQIFLKIL